MLAILIGCETNINEPKQASPKILINKKSP